MKRTTKWLTAVVAAASGLAMANSAKADVILSDFPAGFTLDAYYANWATATIDNSTPGFSVTSAGYGSGYKAINIDGSGNTIIQMTFDLEGPAGLPISSAIADLTDADGTQVQYAMQYGVQAGNGQTYSMLLSAGNVAAPGADSILDLANLTAFNIEDDPGGYSGPYTITYTDLRLVPEPASLTLLVLGAAGLLAARRRVR